jgi:hypothetical protein
MYKILEHYFAMLYYFCVFALACIVLAVVEIINLPGLFRRKEKP